MSIKNLYSIPLILSLDGPGARVMDIEFLAVSPADFETTSCISPSFPVTGSRSNFNVVPSGAVSESKRDKISGFLGQKHCALSKWYIGRLSKHSMYSFNSVLISGQIGGKSNFICRVKKCWNDAFQICFALISIRLIKFIRKLPPLYSCCLLHPFL